MQNNSCGGIQQEQIST